MGVVDKLQTLAKTEIKVIRETNVTTTKTTNVTKTPETTPAPDGSVQAFLAELESAKKVS